MIAAEAMAGARPGRGDALRAVTTAAPPAKAALATIANTSPATSRRRLTAWLAFVSATLTVFPRQEY